MGLISEVITGVISPVTNVLGSWLNKKQDDDLEKFKVDGRVDLQLIQAHVDILRLNASLLQNKWMIRLQVAFGGPLAVFYAKCLLWDKVFADLTHGHTDPLAGDIATYSTWIVGFLFLHSAVTSWVRKT